MLSHLMLYDSECWSCKCLDAFERFDAGPDTILANVWELSPYSLRNSWMNFLITSTSCFIVITCSIEGTSCWVAVRCSVTSQCHYHGCNNVKPRRQHRSESFCSKSWKHRRIIIISREEVKNVLHMLYIDVWMTRTWFPVYVLFIT